MRAGLRARRRAVGPRGLSAALAVLVALTAAGAASAASTSIHAKVAKKTITITGTAAAGGSAAGGGDVVQVNADPRKCAKWKTESKRTTKFTDFDPAQAGPFKFKFARSGFTTGKPRPHYICAYLLVLHNGNFKSLASASRKLK